VKFFFGTVVCLFLIAIAGCDSEPKLTSPKLNPEDAAAKAIAAYDTDSDGQLSKDEAKKCALDPAAGWDANNDGKIDESEIVDRLTTYDAMKPGLQMNVTCRVFFKGKPLVGAEVVYEPEEFMGGAVCAASGTTDEDGVAGMVADELVDPTMQGMHTGLYKIRVTHPEKDLAPKYNTETELFVELSPLDMMTKAPVLKLK